MLDTHLEIIIWDRISLSEVSTQIAQFDDPFALILKLESSFDAISNELLRKSEEVIVLSGCSLLGIIGNDSDWSDWLISGPVLTSAYLSVIKKVQIDTPFPMIFDWTDDIEEIAYLASVHNPKPSRMIVASITE